MPDIDEPAPGSRSVRWTGIGGLPFADSRRAIAHVFDHYPLMPFLPEPAADDAGMLADALPAELPRAAHSGFGVRLEAIGAEDVVARAFAGSRERVAATPIIERARRLVGAMPVPREGATLKGQLAGPTTLLRCIRDAGGIPLWAYPDLHETIAGWCAQLARELACVLLEVSDDVTVWLDEPGLGLAGLEDEDAAVLDVLGPAVEMLRDLEVAPGVHCCAEPPLPLLAQLGLDWVHIDVVRHERILLAEAASVAAMFDSGTRLVLGCLPVQPSDDVRPPLEIASALAAAMGRTLAEVLPHLALAPACGTMLAPPEREIEIAEILARRAREMSRIS